MKLLARSMRTGKLVQRIMFRIDRGHTGVTICKGDCEKAAPGRTGVE